MKPNSPSADSSAPSDSPQGLSSQQVEEIYELYHRELRAFLIGVLRDRELAQDALQLTFQRVSESGATARRETVRGWLFQVAYREALQIRRREHRDVRHLQAVSVTVAHWDLFSPAEQLVTAEQVERLRQAIAELPPEQRQVVERRVQADETFAAIAADLRIPLGTVLTRMRTAIEKLRKRMHDE